ncbi:hypothetical protein WDW37_18850 [Bdellovibrionota bacterium FG-1]
MRFLSLLALLVSVNGSADTVADYTKAASSPTIPIEDFLREAQNAGKAPNGCSNPVDSNYRDTDFVLAKGEWDRDLGCHPFSVAKLCEQANQQCRYKACWTFDDSDQKRRFASPELRKQIFSFAKARFEKYLGEKSMQQMCCAGNEACVDRFKSTRLLILKGLPTSDYHGLYSRLKHAVTSSEARLLNCMNRQCIERFFLHELGHACQDSRHNAIDRYLLGTKVCTFLPEISLPDLESFGPTGPCLREELKKEADKRISEKRPTCYGNWLREAFADIVFSFKRTDITQWSWNCSEYQGTDELHGPNDLIMKCIFERTEPKAHFCPETGHP